MAIHRFYKLYQFLIIDNHHIIFQFDQNSMFKKEQVNLEINQIKENEANINCIIITFKKSQSEKGEKKKKKKFIRE